MDSSSLGHHHICLAFCNSTAFIRQMNTINILWAIIGTVAFFELARLYYRVHTLESNFERLLTALERAAQKHNSRNNAA
jgi:hypothetical protein